MKDIIILAEADDVHGFMSRLWRTDFFRESHARGGLVHRAVDQFSNLPRFVFRTSNEIETAHFSPWWGGLQLRDNYTNAAIQDLYHFHEIWHAGTMRYKANIEFANFQRKMIDNELEASVMSEMLIYYEMPDLRKHTFPHEIFVDRFLFPNGPEGNPDPVAINRFIRNPDLLLDTLKLERRDVMMAQRPDLTDPVKYWIQKYSHQNESWAHLWHAGYNTVETAMTVLIDDCHVMGRQAAMDKFITWLTSDEITQGTDIPFPDEAHAMAGVYALNKNLYKRQFSLPAATEAPLPTAQNDLNRA